MTGFEMDREANCPGCNIRYSVQGSGPPLLFIQGVGVHGFGWQPQIEELSTMYQCIAFDNRGLGKSQPNGAAIMVERMAEDALAVLDAEQIESAHIVGHSLGGLVALQLALLAKNRVRSLSLLCTFPSGRMVAPLTLRMMWLGMGTQIGTKRMRRNAFMRIVLPPGPVQDIEGTAQRLALLFGHDLADQPSIVNAQLRAMRACDLTSRLGELSQIPTLVVSALHDPIAPIQAGKAIRDGIPGAGYIELPDASHGMPITHAKQTNGLIREHLKRLQD